MLIDDRVHMADNQYEFLYLVIAFFLLCASPAPMYWLLKTSRKWRDAILFESTFQHAAISFIGFLGMGFPFIFSSVDSYSWSGLFNFSDLFVLYVVTWAFVCCCALVSGIWPSILLFEKFARESASRELTLDQQYEARGFDASNFTNVKGLETLEAHLAKHFSSGLDETVKKALSKFAKAAKAGDLQQEIALNAKAVDYLINPLFKIKSHAPQKYQKLVNSVIDSVFEQIMVFQQETWSTLLSASLHFELELGEYSDLNFGYLKEDAEFGEYGQGISSRFAYFHFGVDTIQVRGERLVIGCNVFQITSATKITVRHSRHDGLDYLETQVRGDRWALELEIYGYDDVDEYAENDREEHEEWLSQKSQVSHLVEAIAQVQRSLKLLEDHESAIREKERLANQHVGTMFGEWRGVRRLGEGAFGQVWLAEKRGLEDASPSQKAAIKVFSSADFQSLRQFQAEVSSLEQLGKHPNIAHLMDFAKSGNTFWFATNFIGETSLGTAVKMGWQIDLQRLVVYSTQLFAALAHAHERNLSHGDVHPGNLVLTNDKSAIVLVDFGLATFSGRRTQEALTNLAYRAPELLEDAPKVSVKNDVYSAAVTILTLARGKSPWNSIETEGLMGEVKRGSPSLSGLDATVASFLGPLLHRNPEYRPSAGEVFAHLEQHGFRHW